VRNAPPHPLPPCSAATDSCLGFAKELRHVQRCQ
jgi:hypothetical protein